jgi:hypothetical protein
VAPTLTAFCEQQRRVRLQDMEGHELQSAPKAILPDKLRAFYPHLDESAALCAAEALRQYVEIAREIVEIPSVLTPSQDEGNVKTGAVDPIAH